MQTVCVLLQESNHTFMLCFTSFFYILHLIIYNNLSFNHFSIPFNHITISNNHYSHLYIHFIDSLID